MDFSLDDVIKERKISFSNGGRVRKQESRMKMRRPQMKRSFRSDPRSLKRPKPRLNLKSAKNRYKDVRNRGNVRNRDVERNWDHDLHARHLRTEPPYRNPYPTKLLISNLHPKVNSSDILDLFLECGDVYSAEVQYDSSGQSLCSAQVTYYKMADTLKAMKAYNGVPLDGRCMQIETTVSADKFVPDFASSRSTSGKIIQFKMPHRRTFANRAEPPNSPHSSRQRSVRLPSKDTLDQELDAYVKDRSFF